MLNNVISIRNTSLYGFLASFVVFACKTAQIEPKWRVSKGPSTHLSFCALKTTWLASELLVSIGASPHLSFLHVKHDFWIWIRNLYGSQTSPMVLCMQNSVISSRITCLYGSQTSAVVLLLQKSVISIRILVSKNPSPHLWFLHAKE